MVGAVHNPFAIRREEWPAVISEFVSQLFNVLAVSVHRVDIKIAIAQGSEHDLLAIQRDRSLGIISGSARELLKIRTIRIGRENIVAGVHGPRISLRIVRSRRTLFVSEMGR